SCCPVFESTSMRLPYTACMISAPCAPPPGFLIGSSVGERKRVENVNWPPFFGGPALPALVDVVAPGALGVVEAAWCLEDEHEVVTSASTATTGTIFRRNSRLLAAITGPPPH